jgi:hypothetical protein
VDVNDVVGFVMAVPEMLNEVSLVIVSPHKKKSPETGSIVKLLEKAFADPYIHWANENVPEEVSFTRKAEDAVVAGFVSDEVVIVMDVPVVVESPYT